MSWDLGSPAVEASDRCEGAIDGVRVGVALYVDMRVEARWPADCGLAALDCGCDMVVVLCSLVVEKDGSRRQFIRRVKQRSAWQASTWRQGRRETEGGDAMTYAGQHGSRRLQRVRHSESELGK